MPFLRTVAMFFFLCLSFTMQGQDQDYTLLVFEGSDWCANCRRLNKKVLSTSEIQNFLDKKSIALQKVDFPQRKKTSRFNSTAEQGAGRTIWLPGRISYGNACA